MNIEEIDNIYANDISKANEYFLNGIKNKEKKEILEKNYKEKLAYASAKYEKNVKALLKKRKIEPKKKIKKDKTEYFVNKEAKYERTFFQEMKLKLKIYLFNLRINLRNLEEKLWEGSLSYEYKKAKLILKHKFTFLRNKVTYIYNRSEKKFSAFTEEKKSLVKQSYDKFKENSTRLMTRLKPKKKVEPNKPTQQDSAEKSQQNSG